MMRYVTEASRDPETGEWTAMVCEVDTHKVVHVITRRSRAEIESEIAIARYGTQDRAGEPVTCREHIQAVGAESAADGAPAEIFDLLQHLHRQLHCARANGRTRVSSGN